jgi:hypothetical protein
MEKLDRDLILAALSSLNCKLEERSVIAELCLFGGATMVLAFHARLSTRDLDAVFQPAQTVRAAAAEVAAELDLPAGWMNDGVKGWLSPRGETTSEDLPLLPNLRLTRPTTKYLLAMKCLAARAPGLELDGDGADIKFLVQRLGLRSAEEVLGLVEQFYDPARILPKTRFLVEEIMSKISPKD